MKQQMFAVFDSKAKAFMLPFYAPLPAIAVRHFETAANDPNLELCKHAEDFTLFHVGEFDDATGVVAPLLQHVSYGLAASYQKPTLKGSES